MMKVRLYRVRVNQGGYDATGYYWGIGPKLWHAFWNDEDDGMYFRAHDRDAAKAEVRQRWFDATFYR